MGDQEGNTDNAKCEINGVFGFGYAKDCEVESNKCNISIEQVREVGEMIGVSWLRAEGGKELEDTGREVNEEGWAVGDSHN